MREQRVREPDAAVRDVEHVVEPLEERHAIDEVEAFPTRGANVANDEVDAARTASNKGVQVTL